MSGHTDFESQLLALFKDEQAASRAYTEAAAARCLETSVADDPQASSRYLLGRDSQELAKLLQRRSRAMWVGKNALRVSTEPNNDLIGGRLGINRLSQRAYYPFFASSEVAVTPIILTSEPDSIDNTAINTGFTFETDVDSPHSDLTWINIKHYLIGAARKKPRLLKPDAGTARIIVWGKPPIVDDVYISGGETAAWEEKIEDELLELIAAGQRQSDSYHELSQQLHGPEPEELMVFPHGLVLQALQMMRGENIHQHRLDAMRAASAAIYPAE